VSYKDLKGLMSDLKLVYGAVNEEAALYALEEVRTLIYTTNAVEGFHRMLRKYTKTKTIYPTDDAVRKSVYLSVQEISKKWTMPIRDWGAIMGATHPILRRQSTRVGGIGSCRGAGTLPEEGVSVLTSAKVAKHIGQGYNGLSFS
jgi:transposase-like protein